ncbi:hypothetical protein N7474_006726 [Penicillium riverlandense]|uniref:uncharacterized protein n=1 Tax=Penicillium riverlandense TaxID=1903569 RepID=UPI0025491B56|nr:uncharacterized protein N7474_006726 [Penicillium riverlandense]KAJ5814949.1 hypothetical protein N7474_006726 [Penicillium riverlandense]
MLVNEQSLLDADCQVSLLKQQVAKLVACAAEKEIRDLHYKYGYYLDKGLYKEVVDCFSTRPDAYMQFLNGRFYGPSGIGRIFKDRFGGRYMPGRNGPIYGYLLDHMLCQEIITINATVTAAKMRGRTLMQAGTHESMPDDIKNGKKQWWEGGLYESEFILENGMWKIYRLRFFPVWHSDFEHGWRYTKPDFVPGFTASFPEDALGPDETISGHMLWPDTRVVPFHYQHPLTAREVEEEDMMAPPVGENTEACKRPLSIPDPSF